MTELITLESPQRTEAWFQARLGKLTASRIADATARIKAGWGASRANYLAELLTERLTGQPYPRYSNAAMEWGTQNEPEARTVYEFEHNVAVQEVGFVEHPTIPMSGASPDGLVGDDGLVEFKCPNTATHIEILLGGEIDARYVKQMLWQLSCRPEREWVDFVSYDPRLPMQMRMCSRRITRIGYGLDIKKLEGQAVEFLAELDGKEARLRNIGLLNQSVSGNPPDNLLEQLRKSAAIA